MSAPEEQKARQGRDWTYFVSRLVVLFVGVLVGFFGAFNVVFSDIGGWVDRFVGLSTVLGMYLFVGFVAGLVGPHMGWRWTWWISLPGVVLVGLYTIRETQAWPWHLIVLAVALVSGALGGLAGSRARGQGRESGTGE